MPKTVIILGAGASMTEGAPSQTALLRDYFSWMKTAPRKNELREMNAGLEDFFASIWGIDTNARDVNRLKFPTFEEALGILELAQARGEFLRGFGGVDADRTHALAMRQWLIASIALILQEKLENIPRVHDRLVRGVRGQVDDISFISLNYDIIIDNALLREGIRPDYGFMPADPHTMPSHRDVIPLSKIHGSLNWMYCPTCGHIDVRPGEKIAARAIYDFHVAKCGRCQQHRIAVVIPPSFFKVFNNLHLQQVWLRAEQQLRDAERIIFCGYSFPEADIHFKYVLKRAEINRNGRPANVFIVNEHGAKSQQERELEQYRYARFFRAKHNVYWTTLGFSEFAADPEAVAGAANPRAMP